MKKYVLNIMIVLALLLSLTTAVFAQDGDPSPSFPESGTAKVFLPMVNAAIETERQVPVSLDGMKLDSPMTLDNTLARELWGASGNVDVVVTLAGDSVGKVLEDGGGELAQAARFNAILDQQAAFLASLDIPFAELGSAQRLLNAVMITVDASELEGLAQNPEVLSIKPVVDYQFSAVTLDELVEEIGASDVHDSGYTGEGISIAVLDTGIDYTHIQLGGSGDPQDFADQDETTLADGGFPNDKVVGGYDFVGSVWPDGDLAPDEDPLDKPSTVGHGTGCASIAGGLQGVAPDADLYAVKVCSSVSSACAGTALINGMEFAVDPNGDGVLTDAVDVISMSLGSLYGNSFYDDLSLAVNQASMIGVITAAAAGNAGNKPYISDSPGSAPTSISVAATHTPDHIKSLMEVTAPADIAGLYVAIHQSWSAAPYLVEAPVVYAGDIDPANANGCAPFPAGTFTDVIALVDRGGCTFTSKILNVEAGDALVGIIGLVAAGDPFDGGFGGEGYPNIPGYMISQADSNMLKGATDPVVKFDPAVGVSEAYTMESFSGRGPSPWLNYIKPEIAAYADVLGAEWGTGTGTHSFSGTSTSTPVVAGSAALIKEKLLATTSMPAKAPDIPFIVKSMLVNNANPDIRTEPLDFFGGELAPISRVGGGELRVDNAAMVPISLWEATVEGMRLPTASFGLVDVTEDMVLEKKIVVNNWTTESVVYDLSATFRYVDDEDAGVTVNVFPETLIVPEMQGGKRGEAGFIVQLVIDGSELHDWVMNSGSNGNNPDAMTYNEYDGYIWLDNVATTDDDENMTHMPWMVLPRKSGNLMADPAALSAADFDGGIAMVDLANYGVQTSYVDPYAWLAHSDELGVTPVMGSQVVPVDIKDVGVMTYPVPAGYCSGDPSFILVFAITTYDRWALPIATPLFDIMLDVDQDGTYDYDIFNYPLGLNLDDGRSVVYVADLATNLADAWFFLDSNTNTGNYSFALCGEQIGMNAADFFVPMDMDVFATDYYYSELTTDAVLGLEISPLGERYVAYGVGPAPGTFEPWTVEDWGPVGTNPGELGVMFLFSDGTAANENMTIPVIP